MSLVSPALAGEFFTTNTTLEVQFSSVQSLSHVRLFATPLSVAPEAPLSMGVLQARILEWVAIPSSRSSSQPKDRTRISFVSCIGR